MVRHILGSTLFGGTQLLEKETRVAQLEKNLGRTKNRVVFLDKNPGSAVEHTTKKRQVGGSNPQKKVDPSPGPGP